MAGFGGSAGLALIGSIQRAMRERKEAEAKAQEDAIRMRLLQAQTGTAEANLAEMPADAARRAETHSTAQQRSRREETEAQAASDRAAADVRRQTETRDATMRTMSDLIRQANPGLSDDEIRTRATSAVGGGPDVVKEGRIVEDRAAAAVERTSLQASRNVTVAMNQLRLNAEREVLAREQKVRELSSETFFRKNVEASVARGEASLDRQTFDFFVRNGFKPEEVQEAYEAHAKKSAGVRPSGRGTAFVTPAAARIQAQTEAHTLIDKYGSPEIAKARLTNGAAALIQAGEYTEEELGVILQEIDQVILTAARGETRGGGGSQFEDITPAVVP